MKDELLKEAEDAENENGDWNDAVTFPEIEPILIHAARELAQRLDFSDGSDLTIITPCRELKALGEEKGLEHIHFLTWNEFAKASGLKLVRRDLSDSPIPPGFFAEYGDDMACLSSKEAIEQFFKEKGYRKKWIAEMLFCHQGCHNGNGVI